MMEISHLNLNWAQPEPEQPAEEGVETKWQEEVKSLSTKNFQCMNGADYYVNSSSQHSFQQHYQNNSTHHDRRPTPALALPTQFPSSSSLSANHHGDKNEDDEDDDDEEADNAAGSECERASSSNVGVGSPSNAVHDGRSNNRLWTFFSFIFIVSILSTG
eukprot:scaffold4427_cov142-Skeletonema_menzelii.AAC.1